MVIATALDVFSRDPGRGVPLFVVRAVDEEATRLAADLAREFRRETVLVSGGPTAAEVACFGPGGEADPFGGEAGLAAVYTLAAEGEPAPSFTSGGRSCPGRVEGATMWVGLPVPDPAEVLVTEEVLLAAGLPADAVTGPALGHEDTLLVPLRDRYALEGAGPDVLVLAQAAAARRLVLFAPGAARDAFRARVFDRDGSGERPALALAGAVLAAREAARRREPVALHLESGHAIGRPSDVLVRCAEPEALRVWVGGAVVKVLAGEMAGPGGSR